MKTWEAMSDRPSPCAIVGGRWVGRIGTLAIWAAFHVIACMPTVIGGCSSPEAPLATRCMGGATSPRVSPGTKSQPAPGAPACGIFEARDDGRKIEIRYGMAWRGSYCIAMRNTPWCGTMGDGDMVAHFEPTWIPGARSRIWLFCDPKRRNMTGSWSYDRKGWYTTTFMTECFWMTRFNLRFWHLGIVLSLVPYEVGKKLCGKWGGCEVYVSDVLPHLVMCRAWRYNDTELDEASRRSGNTLSLPRGSTSVR